MITCNSCITFFHRSQGGKCPNCNSSEVEVLIYNRISDDNSLSDSEKRAEYNAEIDNIESEKQWELNQ